LLDRDVFVGLMCSFGSNHGDGSSLNCHSRPVHVKEESEIKQWREDTDLIPCACGTSSTPSEEVYVD